MCAKKPDSHERLSEPTSGNSEIEKQIAAEEQLPVDGPLFSEEERRAAIRELQSILDQPIIPQNDPQSDEAPNDT